MAEISTLKQAPGGDILVAGSADLVDSLMKHDLIDEYQLMVHPIVLEAANAFSEMSLIPLICNSSTAERLSQGSFSSVPTDRRASSKQVLR